PVVGDSLTEWIRGDYLISDATLNRFFAPECVFIFGIIFPQYCLHSDNLAS
ncbi:MAG: hypothetical protein GX483_08675, partial [Actinomycetaceae bacterium]|nr:hypothetical protein [Actinomycetaceae bacterium]